MARIHSFHRIPGGRISAATRDPIDRQLAEALREHLTEASQPELAATVEQLRVVEPCRCGEPGCKSFYTLPAHRVRRLWGKAGETIELAPGLAVDVVDGAIVAVEILQVPQC